MQRFLASAQNPLNGRIGAAWSIIEGRVGQFEAEGGVTDPVGTFTWDAEEDILVPELPHIATFTWDAEDDATVPALPHIANFEWDSETDTVIS